ncbi:MAG: hypothetical protein GEV03_28295 [Streptosporangiales bacterium]|nr:hypothetical protein [Streptosporangiales bacterium]
MVTFADLRDAKPDQLAGAAQTWEQRAKDAGRRAEEMQSDVLDVLKEWSGPASREAMEKLKSLTEELTDARKAMLGVSDALEQAGRDIGMAKAELNGALQYASGKGLTVEDDGSVSWFDWNPLEWAKDETAADHASELIEAAVRRATEADEKAAAYLKWAHREAVNDPKIPLADYRPYGTQDPTDRDHDVRDQAEWLPLGAKIKGWENAEALLRHWLAGSGETYQVDVKEMLNELPSFRKQVEAIVAANKGQGEFNSGWQQTRAHEDESLDYYYALNGFQYRVTGESVVVNGQEQTTYNVEVAKTYNFAANPGEQQRNDFEYEKFGIKFLDIPQKDLAHLHTTGLARDFDVEGKAEFTK